MMVSERDNPDGLVMEVKTKPYPAKPSETMTGVVVGSHFVILDRFSATGSVLPMASVKVNSAEIIQVWTSLKAYYTK